MTRFSLYGTLAVALLCAIPASADQVTFTKDVLPVLQDNCQVCHRPSGQNMSGMVAPMSLMTYEEVRPWAKAITRVVDSGEMPPWHASEAQNGVFANERTMTEDEIQVIKDWVAQGARRGNPSDAPTPVEFKTGWLMGTPDLEISFPEPFFVADEVEDLYHNVTVQITEEQMPQNEWVSDIEFIPGSDVVHHIIAYATDPDSDAIEFAEDEDLETNEEALRGRTMIGGLAPGTDAWGFEEGFGIPLKKGSSMTFAMHYHKESGPGTGQWDDSTMAMKFTEGRPERELTIDNIAHGGFEIPPNHPHWTVSAAHTLEEDTLLLNLMPHSHLRGVESRYIAYYPDGTEEVLLDVPQYDFNWQTMYVFNEPKHMPAGTRIEYETVYDNSPENAARVGFNSNRAVSFGGPTTDEMDLGWYTFAAAEPGVSGGQD